MRFEEILSESYINLHTTEEKSAYGDIVYRLVEIAYGPVGGHCNYRNAQELIADTDMWKLVRRNGEIIFVALYKDRTGRKLIGVGHNGTSEAKAELYKILAADLRLKRSWYEVSGNMVKVMNSAGIPPIPAEYAEGILGKKILSINSDFEYTRLISGQAHKKMLFGWPNGNSWEATVPSDLAGTIYKLAA